MNVINLGRANNMEELTNIQIKILEFLKKYISKNGYSPSFQEIADNVNLKSKASVWYHIKILENKKYIKTGGKARTIVLIKEEL